MILVLCGLLAWILWFAGVGVIQALWVSGFWLRTVCWIYRWDYAKFLLLFCVVLVLLILGFSVWNCGFWICGIHSFWVSNCFA